MTPEQETESAAQLHRSTIEIDARGNHGYMSKHTQGKALGERREIMKGKHGRGQNTTGDREIMEPGSKRTKK
jgi:hypothetical protein